MSGFVDFRRICFEVGAAALMAFLLSLGHGYLTGSGITIEYELYSNAIGQTQVYWSIGDSLSEARQSAEAINAKTRNDVRFDIHEKLPVKLVRIDPFKAPGRFRIQNVRVDLMANLLPIGSWGHWVLNLEDAVATQQLEQRDAGEWEATGNDPYFLFRIPQISTKKIFLLNLLSGLVVVTFVVLLARLTGVVREGPRQPSGHVTTSLALTGIYGAFFIMALLSSEFVAMQEDSRYVVYAVLIIWIMSYVLVGRGLVSRVFVHAVAGLLAIVIVVIPDFLFHLGLVNKSLFSRVDSPLYHWQLGKPLSDNFKHSSLRYYQDFEAIESLIVPGSYFLSDVATSYYVSAALPLYAVNVLPHHRKGVVPISTADLINFCDGTTESSRNRIKNYLAQKAKLHAKNGLAAMRYLFLNVDEKNRHVASQCLAQRHGVIRTNLESILTPVHRGDFIHVYEFRTH